MRSILRYKYRVRWQKDSSISYIYFNFDVKRSNPDESAKLSYIFQNGKTIHTLVSGLTYLTQVVVYLFLTTQQKNR